MATKVTAVAPRSDTVRLLDQGASGWARLKRRTPHRYSAAAPRMSRQGVNAMVVEPTLCQRSGGTAAASRRLISLRVVWDGLAEHPAQGGKCVGGCPTGPGRMGEVVEPLVVQERVGFRVELAREGRGGSGGESLRSIRGDEDVSIGVVDVVGEGFASPPVDRGRVVLGHLLVGEAEES